MKFKPLIIFGAGENGRMLFNYFGKERVYCYCDNKISGGDICSFEEMQELYKTEKFDIILSTNSDEMRQQLKNAGIKYWEFVKKNNNYFSRKELVNDLDRKLYEKYIHQMEYSGKVDRLTNWYRSDIKYEKTAKLIEAMQRNDNVYLNQFYNEDCNEDIIFFDEFYDVRPGMRLLSHIIKDGNVSNVCDIACGHGEFVKHLSELGIQCFASDVSLERCSYLKNSNISYMVGMAEKTDWKSNTFDFVSLQECLEHVVDPFLVMKEAYRIAKKNALIAVTVPYYDHCNSYDHVRTFCENDLYSIAKAFDCKQIKIMRIPYLNWSIEGLRGDSLLMTCVK